MAHGENPGPTHLTQPGTDRTICGLSLRDPKAVPFTGAAWLERYRANGICPRCEQMFFGRDLYKHTSGTQTGQNCSR